MCRFEIAKKKKTIHTESSMFQCWQSPEYGLLYVGVWLLAWESVLLLNVITSLSDLWHHCIWQALYCHQHKTFYKITTQYLRDPFSLWGDSRERDGSPRIFISHSAVSCAVMKKICRCVFFTFHALYNQFARLPLRMSQSPQWFLLYLISEETLLGCVASYFLLNLKADRRVKS